MSLNNIFIIDYCFISAQKRQLTQQGLALPWHWFMTVPNHQPNKTSLPWDSKTEDVFRSTKAHTNTLSKVKIEYK